MLNEADTTQVFKKGSKNHKDNYRLVSILPSTSETYFLIFFSIYQCWFRKDFSAQHCLVTMLGNGKFRKNKGKSFGFLFTDLSKTFECLSHDLLIATRHIHSFESLRLIYSYLKERKQRTKKSYFSNSKRDLLYGVPQGSILGPLSYNIFLYHFFLLMRDVDIASYADDNAPYFVGENIYCVSI